MSIKIMIYAERRTGGGWELAEPPGPEEYWSLATNALEKEPAPVVEIGGRNLNMVLTGLQSPWVGEEVDGIADVRGLPTDLSTELRAWYEAPAGGKWSGRAGWLGLDEILDHDWEGQVLMEAMVESDKAELFTDPPGPFPVGVFGCHAAGPGVRVRWMTTLRELASWLLERDLPRLAALVEDPTDIRLVFWNDCPE